MRREAFEQVVGAGAVIDAEQDLHRGLQVGGHARP
jgi:hypothetical protein